MLPDHLMEFQKKTVVNALTFFRDNDQNCAYIGDEQGLGKTISAIAIMDFLEVSKVVIIPPASVMYSWAEEIRKFSEYDHDIFIVEKGKQIFDPKFKEASVVILSTAMVRSTNFHKLLPEMQWDLMIVDEAHKVKSRESKTAHTLVGSFDRRRKPRPSVWSQSKYRLCLSGTPLSGSTQNAFVWLAKMAPDEFPNYWDFCECFCNKMETDWGNKYFGIRNGRVLHRIINMMFFTRTKKEDALKELPPKVYHKIYLPKELSYKLKIQDEVKKEILELLERQDAGGIADSVHAEPIQLYRREQGMLKVPKVVAFVKDLLEDDVPVLLFAHHISVVDALTEQLKEFSPVVIKGSTPPKMRRKAVKDFQGSLTNLFIGNIAAAGTGLNLQRSQTVVFAEDPWNPDDMMQCEDRAHRKGQEGIVNVYNFIVKNSIDVRVHQVLREKMKAHNQVIDGMVA